MVHGQIYNTETYGLKGKVKKVEVKAYNVIERNGKIMEGSKSCCPSVGNFVYVEFLPQGLLSEIIYSFDGSFPRATLGI